MTRSTEAERQEHLDRLARLMSGHELGDLLAASDLGEHTEWSWGALATCDHTELMHAEELMHLWTRSGGSLGAALALSTRS